MILFPYLWDIYAIHFNEEVHQNHIPWISLSHSAQLCIAVQKNRNHFSHDLKAYLLDKVWMMSSWKDIHRWSYHVDDFSFDHIWRFFHMCGIWIKSHQASFFEIALMGWPKNSSDIVCTFNLLPFFNNHCRQDFGSNYSFLNLQLCWSKLGIRIFLQDLAILVVHPPKLFYFEQF